MLHQEGLRRALAPLHRVPAVVLLRLPHAVPAAEALGPSQPPPNAQGMQVTVRTFADATVAVELALGNALAQWPYVHDMSLIDALAEVFQPLPRDSGGVPPPPPTPAPATWVYINVILTNSNLFAPVIDVAGVGELAATLRGHAAAASGPGPLLPAEAMADMIMAAFFMARRADWQARGGPSEDGGACW